MQETSGRSEARGRRCAAGFREELYYISASRVTLELTEKNCGAF
jgi:hypothetical protein